MDDLKALIAHINAASLIAARISDDKGVAPLLKRCLIRLTYKNWLN